MEDPSALRSAGSTLRCRTFWLAIKGQGKARTWPDRLATPKC